MNYRIYFLMYKKSNYHPNFNKERLFPMNAKNTDHTANGRHQRQFRSNGWWLKNGTDNEGWLLLRKHEYADTHGIKSRL